MPFVIAVALLVMILVGIAGYCFLRSRRVDRNDWMTLLSRLRQLDRDKVAAVALDLLEEQDVQSQLDPELIYDMVGGMNGLDALEQNCDVLIDLAAYVQRWYPEALELAEELRVNSRAIKWHIGRLRGASHTGHLREQFPEYAQRAVATYYLMTRSLLVLYEGVEVPEFAELQRAI
jgi:hypothetical protein